MNDRSDLSPPFISLVIKVKGVSCYANNLGLKVFKIIKKEGIK